MLILHERSGPRSVSDSEYEYHQTKFKRLAGKIKTKPLRTLAGILASDLIPYRDQRCRARSSTFSTLPAEQQRGGKNEFLKDAHLIVRYWSAIVMTMKAICHSYDHEGYIPCLCGISSFDVPGAAVSVLRCRC